MARAQKAVRLHKLFVEFVFNSLNCMIVRSKLRPFAINWAVTRSVAYFLHASASRILSHKFTSTREKAIYSITYSRRKIIYKSWFHFLPILGILRKWLFGECGRNGSLHRVQLLCLLPPSLCFSFFYSFLLIMMMVAAGYDAFFLELLRRRDVKRLLAF